MKIRFDPYPAGKKLCILLKILNRNMKEKGLLQIFTKDFTLSYQMKFLLNEEEGHDESLWKVLI